MSGSRLPRVEELIKEELGNILQGRLTDPRIGFATVSHVKLSKDLRSAVVLVSFLDDGAEAVSGALAALDHAKGFIKRELGMAVKLRYMPELRFIHDHSAVHATHIAQILREVEPEGGWNKEEAAQEEDEK